MTRYRVAVLHDGFIPIYRERFFERLQEVSAHEYVIFHGQPIRGSGHQEICGPFAFPNVRSYNRELHLGRRALVWEPVVRKVLGGGFSALVVGHQFKFVAAMLLFGLFRLRGQPALLWGHGYHRARDTVAARRLSAGVARLADGYLAYTQSGADLLVRHGVAPERITVVRNTIDMDEQAAALRAGAGLDPAALRREFGLAAEGPVLLYVGRLSPRKRIDELFAVVERLSAAGAPVALAVVGDGPERDALQARAAHLSSVRFLGALYDSFAIARLMRVCAATVIPGTVGLAVNHSLAQELPVITRAHGDHSPEIEYLESGVNGLIVEGGFEDFAAAIEGYLRDAALRERLRQGARATARSLDLRHSARQFDQGVVRTIERRRG